MNTLFSSQRRATARRIALLLFLLPVLLVTPLAGAADMEIEVVDLRHRPADEVVPIVSPFVSEGGSINGRDYKLIIKSTPDNIQQIKQLLTKIDTALRDLIVYVSTDYEAVKAEQNIAVEGRVGNDSVELRAQSPQSNEETIVIESGQRVKGGASSETRMYSTQSRSREPAAQTIRVQEGQWAVIRTGKAIPITEERTNPDGTVTRTTRYQSVTSGFKLRPQLNGDKVLLIIRPRRASVSESDSGQINVSGLETTVRTELGKWVELGGSVESLRSRQSGISYSTRRESEQRQRIFVKVELRQE